LAGNSISLTRCFLIKRTGSAAGLVGNVMGSVREYGALSDGGVRF
jgi:hypothetical protein